MRTGTLRKIRRGATAAQMALVLAVIALGVAAATKSAATKTKGELNTTAKGVADPAKLKEKFLP